MYIEIDFPEITTKKAMAIRKSKELMSGLGDAGNVSLGRSILRSCSSHKMTNTAQGGTALHSSRYHLLPTDLRLDPSETLEPLLCSSTDSDHPALLDPSLPTLLLFECVLVYMSPASSSRLLEWFVNLIKSSQNGVLGCIVYEMFGLEDAFGRVMINNLRVRVPDRYEVCNLTLIYSLGASYIIARC